MKNLNVLFVFFTIILFSENAFSQKTFTDASLYNNYIVEKHNGIMKKYLVYIKTSVHSNSENKIDKKLTEMVDEISVVIKDLETIKPMEEDSAGYLISTIEGLKIEKAIYENDLKAAGILQEKSQNSYEDMLNYFAAEEAVSEKMKAASLKIETAQQKFAEDNDMILTESDSKLSVQLDEIAKVNNYANRVYLQYFRAYKPVSLFFEAMNNNLYTEADSLIKEITKATTISVDSLTVIPSFNGNSNLKTKCKSLVSFYKTSSEIQFVQMLEIAKNENSTNADIEKFNKLIETFNNKQNTYSEAYFTAYNTFLKSNIDN